MPGFNAIGMDAVGSNSAIQGAALSGTVSAQSTASGALTTSIALFGAVVAQAGAAATFAAQGAALFGGVVAQASASATLTTAIALSGAAVAQASASGALLTQGATLSGTAVARASASGTLTTSISLSGSALCQPTVAANLTDVYANIVIDPERILVIPSPNQPRALASAVITDYVLRSGQWTIDKDPRSDLFYGIDARTDLALAQTTVVHVVAIPTGVTLSLPGFVHDPAGIVGAKISGMDTSSDDAVNSVTFLFTCANTEVVPHTIYFRNRPQ